MNIGERIKVLRKQSGLSGRKFASLTGLDPSQITKIENNSSKPSLDSLDRICTVLNISLSEFFAEESPETSLEFTLLINTLKDYPPEQLAHLRQFLDFYKNK